MVQSEPEHPHPSQEPGEDPLQNAEETAGSPLTLALEDEDSERPSDEEDDGTDDEWTPGLSVFLTLFCVHHFGTLF